MSQVSQRKAQAHEAGEELESQTQVEDMDSTDADTAVTSDRVLPRGLITGYK